MSLFRFLFAPVLLVIATWIGVADAGTAQAEPAPAAAAAPAPASEGPALHAGTARLEPAGAPGVAR